MHPPSLFLYEEVRKKHRGILLQGRCRNGFLSVHFGFDHLGLELSLISVGQDNAVL